MPTYFVTGATGFIGRHLLERLLEREGDIHVLVRAGSREKLDAIVAAARRRRPDQARGRRPRRSRCSASTRPTRDALRGNVDHFFHLAAIYDMAADEDAERAAQRRRHAARRRARQRPRGGPLPPRLLDRGRRHLRGPLHRGHVRRGPAAAHAVPPDEVRGREARPRARAGRVARLPARDRRRRLAHGRDGQDRRPLLLLQGDPEGPPRAAGVVPARRPRGRLDEHRPGRLGRRRDGPHRAPATASTARPSTSSTRARSAPATCSTRSPAPATRRRWSCASTSG